MGFRNTLREDTGSINDYTQDQKMLCVRYNIADSFHEYAIWSGAGQVYLPRAEIICSKELGTSRLRPDC